MGVLAEAWPVPCSWSQLGREVGQFTTHFILVALSIKCQQYKSQLTNVTMTVAPNQSSYPLARSESSHLASFGFSMFYKLKLVELFPSGSVSYSVSMQ